MKRCANCGEEIRYSADDVVYLHVELTWGSDFFRDPDYNNRFYCDQNMRLHADPERVPSDSESHHP